MKLYLVRHGDAKTKEEDPLRPLSEKGISEINKIAKYAKNSLKIELDLIYYSSKLRAKETAAIITEQLNPVKGMEQTDNLEPLSNPKVWKDRLKSINKNIMIVGHLPHLSRLLNHLINLDEDFKTINFTTGGLVSIIKVPNYEWTIQWILSPEIIP